MNCAGWLRKSPTEGTSRHTTSPNFAGKMSSGLSTTLKQWPSKAAKKSSRPRLCGSASIRIGIDRSALAKKTRSEQDRKWKDLQRQANEQRQREQEEFERDHDLSRVLIRKERELSELLSQLQAVPTEGWEYLQVCNGHIVRNLSATCSKLIEFLSATAEANQ